MHSEASPVFFFLAGKLKLHFAQLRKLLTDHYHTLFGPLAPSPVVSQLDNAAKDVPIGGCRTHLGVGGRCFRVEGFTLTSVVHCLVKLAMQVTDGILCLKETFMSVSRALLLRECRSYTPFHTGTVIRITPGLSYSHRQVNPGSIRMGIDVQEVKGGYIHSY